MCNTCIPAAGAIAALAGGIDALGAGTACLDGAAVGDSDAVPRPARPDKRQKAVYVAGRIGKDATAGAELAEIGSHGSKVVIAGSSPGPGDLENEGPCNRFGRVVGGIRSSNGVKNADVHGAAVGQGCKRSARVEAIRAV